MAVSCPLIVSFIISTISFGVLYVWLIVIFSVCLSGWFAKGACSFNSSVISPVSKPIASYTSSVSLSLYSILLLVFRLLTNILWE